MRYIPPLQKQFFMQQRFGNLFDFSMSHLFFIVVDMHVELMCPVQAPMAESTIPERLFRGKIASMVRNQPLHFILSSLNHTFMH